jgi:hypothetical protein
MHFDDKGLYVFHSSISSIAVFQKRCDYQELSQDYLSPSEYEKVYKHFKETIIPKINFDINIQEDLKKTLMVHIYYKLQAGIFYYEIT